MKGRSTENANPEQPSWEGTVPDSFSEQRRIKMALAALNTILLAI
jgi:hypothetical protein